MVNKKAISVLFIFVCFTALIFISTFLPITTIAVENTGHWEEFPNGTFQCFPGGSECSISMKLPVG